MQAILVIVALMVCFGICFWGTIEFQRILGVQFIEIRNNSNIISVATAEEISNNDIQLIPTPTPNPPSIIQRDVWAIDETNINDTLSDRYEIWQLGCQYIQDNPETLFYGVSVDGTIGPIVGRPHCHNILLQTLLEGGFPALFLYLSLLFYATYHAFRLWNRRHIPFWQRILPLPVFSILLWEMAECLTHFSYGHPPMTLFWFFLGATITVGKSLGKAPKSPEIPTETIVIESGE